jgi:hypothetical protein
MYLQSSANRFSFYNVDATTELARLDNNGLDLKVGKFSVNGATVPTIGGDGGIEIGNYLDMHDPGLSDGRDFAVRLQAVANAGGYKLSVGANALDVGGLQMASLTDIATKMATGNVGNTDFNGLTSISGAYRFEVPSANGPGYNFGQVLIVHGGGDTIAQVAFDYLNGDFSWRAGNPPSVGGGGAWSAWDKISNYVKKSDPTFTGATMWLNTNKALWQHDGSNAYFRSQVGDLHLGAGGNTKLSINGTTGAMTAVGPITINVGAANVGLDLASNDAWLGTRVLRNSNASIPGMFIGYSGYGPIRFYASDTALTTDLRMTISQDGGVYLPQGGWHKYEHASQLDVNDGTISAGKFAEGLNIIGVQTVAAAGRKIAVWGKMRSMDAGGGLYNYNLDSRPGGGRTISSAAPSGGTDGDIWFQV